MMVSDPPVLGLLGLGLLGTAVAQRLLAAGFPVIGYDPHAQAMVAARQLGVIPAGSAPAVACECSVLLACLPDGPSVRQALLDVSGSPILAPGSLFIDFTTCAPAESRTLAEILESVDIQMLDAPISGGSRQIAEGRGLIMVGGPEAAFRRGSPLLSAVAERVRHLGPAGSGSTGKLVTNLVLGLNRLALAEGLALAEAAGLDLAASLELLKESAAYSRAMDVKGERMVEHRYAEPEARLRQHLKDVRLILELAEEWEQTLPVSALHAKILDCGVEMGLGDVDNAAVLEILRGQFPG